MLKSQILSSLIALGTTTRSGAAVTTADLTPWLDAQLPALIARAQALRDGATWGEVTALIDAVVTAGQALKPILKGVPRAGVVLAVLQALVREFAPPSAQWLRMLLDSPFAAMLVEMAFRRLFPGG